VVEDNRTQPVGDLAAVRRTSRAVRVGQFGRACTMGMDAT